jgi:hypothetical protein
MSTARWCPPYLRSCARVLFLACPLPITRTRGGWTFRRPTPCGACIAAFLVLLLWYAALHVRDCPAPPAPTAPSLPPISLHTRSFAAPPPPSGAQVDLVFVSGFPQQLQSSLRSLCQFMDPAGVGRVHVIVPDRMAAYFEASVPQLQCEAGGAAGALRFKVWSESALVPPFTRDAPFEGTQRQMVLKLAAAFIVDAPFYLVMDSDVYARRPFGVGDLLVRDGGGGGVTRARTGLDQLDFPQPGAWFAESAALLQTRLVGDTDAFCGDDALAGEAQWFAATGNASVPGEDGPPPFALLAQRGPRAGALVYGACRSGRGHATHVTPMVLARALVREVVVPRLEAVAGPGAQWYDALLAYQARREAQCWRAILRKARFYSWTEYSLYFVAAVAAGALDQYHAFHAGPITSYRYSVMAPDAYDAMDWDAVFRDGGDDAPFFIVHSWFAKPLATTHLYLGKHIKGLPIVGAEAPLPEAPTPLPFYR